jgi:hypothetical protein
MRRFLSQPVLLAAALAVLAVLGGANRARAAYVAATGRAPGAGDARTTDLAVNWLQGGGDLGGAQPGDESPTDVPPKPVTTDGPLPPWAFDHSGLQNQSGTGAPSGGSGSAGGAAAQYVSPAERPDVSPDNSANRLDVESVACLPPSLASRLFRPPRDVA